MIEYRPLSDYNEAADMVAVTNGVFSVDVIEHDGRLDRPAIEIVVGPGFERVPPRVLRRLADHDLGLYPPGSGKRGDYFILVAV